MKVIGIIAEYDPFHNGHAYMLENVRRSASADFVICIMSGEFTQRGFPACFDKCIRAEMAVRGGADVVLELPYIYACSSGREFAEGGVGILDGLGCITDLAFGAESDNTDRLISLASVTEDDDIKDFIQDGLLKGSSYGEALTKALEMKCGKNEAALIRQPNNLLAIEYIRALNKIRSEISPFAIKRVGAFHDSRYDLNKADKNESEEKELSKEITSGSAIRKILLDEEIDIFVLKKLVPKTSFELMKNSDQIKVRQRMYDILRYRLISDTTYSLSEICDINEGLEHRMKEAASVCSSFEEFEHYVKSKRYTLARIRRMTSHIIMNFTRADFQRLKGTRYARILGFNDKGAVLIKHMKETTSIPVISNLNKLRQYDEDIRDCLSVDRRAVDIYDILNGTEDLLGRDQRIIPYME